MNEDRDRRWNGWLVAGCWTLLVGMLPSLARRTLAAFGIDWRETTDGDRLETLVGVLFGLPSLLVGVVGAYLAYLAIRMGRDNERVTDKQVQILEKLEELEGAQAKLAERQNEINEEEHARWKEEQDRKLDLRLRGSGQNREFTSVTMSYGPTVVTLRVKNGSDKTADGFFWEVLVPRSLKYKVKFMGLDGGKEVEGRFHPLAKNDVYDSIDGHYPHKLFGWSTVDVCRLSINAEHASTQEFWIKWRISCEDGGVPKAGGHAKIHYKRGPDGTFGTYHPDPNGDQDLMPELMVDQGAED